MYLQHKKSTVYLFLLICLIANFGVAAAQHWERMSAPATGNVRCLESYGNALACSIEGQGVYTSVNGGQDWVARNDGLTNRFINELAISNNLIYAATNRGLFRASLSSGSWTDISEGLPDKSIVSVVVNDDGDLFAAIKDMGVYRKTVMGEEWEEMNYNLPGKNISRLAATKSGPFIIILAAADGNGIYRTSDNGETWSAANYGHNLDYVYKFDKSPDGKLYAFGYDGSVWVTSNGVSWDEFSDEIISDHITSIGFTFSEAVPASSREGLFHWVDSLDSYASPEASFGGVAACTALSSGTFYAAVSDSGLYKSADDGISWQYSSLAPSGVIKNSKTLVMSKWR